MTRSRSADLTLAMQSPVMVTSSPGFTSATRWPVEGPFRSAISLFSTVCGCAAPVSAAHAPPASATTNVPANANFSIFILPKPLTLKCTQTLQPTGSVFYFMSVELNIAHRGGAQLWPENTLPAFIAAASAGSDAAELDVQLTHDDRLIVFHDFRLKRD